MRQALWLAILFPAAAFAVCASPQVRDAAALSQAEHAWAGALERRDAEAVGCILAREFQDADPDGQLHTRSETLAAIANRRPGANQLSELDPHVYGDFGYIRGLATRLDPEGKVRSRLRFTDIYVYREGRWQAVAGQETLVK